MTTSKSPDLFVPPNLSIMARGPTKSTSPEKSSKTLSYSTLQSSSVPPPSPKRASETTQLLQPPLNLRTQSDKTPGDPATLLIEAENLQKAFIDTLPFRSADTRLVQQWLSNWFGHHADCPELDRPHLASLTRVTWDGKVLRSYSKEMLFVDLVGWEFRAGDARPLVEDIEEARVSLWKQPWIGLRTDLIS